MPDARINVPADVPRGKPFEVRILIRHPMETGYRTDDGGKQIPRNVLTLCVGKSTYARCGIITNVTPFEPEWEGFVTLEISNTTPLPAKVYAEEGIAQVLFFTADEGDECEVSYADKKGKYQAQRGITLPKL